MDSAYDEHVLTIPKNLILCGPPGTGKTYSTVLYAVSIIEEKPLETIKKENYADVFEVRPASRPEPRDLKENSPPHPCGAGVKFWRA